MGKDAQQDRAATSRTAWWYVLRLLAALSTPTAGLVLGLMDYSPIVWVPIFIVVATLSAGLLVYTQKRL